MHGHMNVKKSTSLNLVGLGYRECAINMDILYHNFW